MAHDEATESEASTANPPLPTTSLTQKPAAMDLPMLDGLTATMLDEEILRGEPQLKHYWSSRLAAKNSCSQHITEHRAAVEVPYTSPEISFARFICVLELPVFCQACVEVFASASLGALVFNIETSRSVNRCVCCESGS